MTEKFDELHSSASADTVRWLYGEYTRQDLMAMDPTCLRALFRERVHHTIEVEIYPILVGDKQATPIFGTQAQICWEVLSERGFPLDDPDLQWGKKYLDLAAKIRAGEKVTIDEPLPEKFNADEMAVVNKLIWDRRSIRDWVQDKPVPQDMLEQIMEAGRAAPNGCNLNVVRFAVINDPEEMKMVWSDIPTPANRCTIIVICYDKAIYETVGHDRLVPHNMMLDCAAAGDHMCLMAHALGLGAVWLTCTDKTAARFKKKYGLPDNIEQALHLAIGWPSVASIKSLRMPLKDMMLTRGK
ncbi:MAG: nitroreductase family protein [Desulfarculus sp.]|nr:nitroreductase family protein [Pseudomonadota bacterium]MBV1718024.1 nitroreductase family protein [Desulfarculus sp.]MBU4575464.1 nitroreductase family protein [Pseudomonadota bacterium]MBU4597529.1 nitroreductase family protein [Pseudomonadota bacterium]MBV1739263.1 nitroreductase family protein [Desulfarculus sp.]